jgi:signal peptidase II
MREKILHRRLALAVAAMLATLILLADRISKDTAESVLGTVNASQPFIPGVLELRLTYNTGAAWGVFQGGRVYFVVIAIVAVITVIIYLISLKQHPILIVVGFGLFIGGSIGNAFDRIVSGKVVDFMNFLFIDFPIFNIADSAISVGASLVILSLVLGYFTEAVEADVNGSVDDSMPDNSLPTGVFSRLASRERTAARLREQSRNSYQTDLTLRPGTKSTLSGQLISGDGDNDDR